MQKDFAGYLLEGDRMIVEPTEEMMRRFPLGTPAGDTLAWLKAAAKLLGGAVELRQPATPAGRARLVVKDRAVLFNYTQEGGLEDMAKDRKNKENA